MTTNVVVGVVGVVDREDEREADAGLDGVTLGIVPVHPAGM